MKIQRKLLKEYRKVVFDLTDELFFQSQSWLMLRFLALVRSGGKCELCRKKAEKDEQAIRLFPSHIYPRIQRPELQYDLSNLETLCEECDQNKKVGIYKPF